MYLKSHVNTLPVVQRPARIDRVTYVRDRFTPLFERKKKGRLDPDNLVQGAVIRQENAQHIPTIDCSSWSRCYTRLLFFVRKHCLRKNAVQRRHDSRPSCACACTDPLLHAELWLLRARQIIGGGRKSMRRASRKFGGIDRLPGLNRDPSQEAPIPIEREQTTRPSDTQHHGVKKVYSSAPRDSTKY
jgi:hypothetical protein